LGQFLPRILAQIAKQLRGRSPRDCQSARDLAEEPGPAGRALPGRQVERIPRPT